MVAGAARSMPQRASAARGPLRRRVTAGAWAPAVRGAVVVDIDSEPRDRVGGELLHVSERLVDVGLTGQARLDDRLEVATDLHPCSGAALSSASLVEVLKCEGREEVVRDLGGVRDIRRRRDLAGGGVAG